MQVEKKFYCDFDSVRFVRESNLTLEDGTNLTLLVTDGPNNNMYELMIFLGKATSGSEYEVMVYKKEPSDKYVPHSSDNVAHYEENDEYISFFFKDYYSANSFASNIGYIHEEYQRRPAKKVEIKN